MKEVFYEADVVAMPSRTEGFGLIALEAISADVPVLLTRESGIAKALEQVDGGKSVIIKSEDPEEWSQKIRTLSEMKLKEKLTTSINFRESYNKTFSWDTQCENFKEIISRMVSDSCCAESDEGKLALHFHDRGLSSSYQVEKPQDYTFYFHVQNTIRSSQFFLQACLLYFRLHSGNC